LIHFFLFFLGGGRGKYWAILKLLGITLSLLVGFAQYQRDVPNTKLDLAFPIIRRMIHK